jgi:conjugative transfer signal peptidase TraF
MKRFGPYALKKKFAVLYILITSLCFAACGLVFFYALGYRVNLSDSLPGYIYRVTPLKEGEVMERGGDALIDLSSFHNPVIELGIRRGYVSRNRKMLKEIGAVPGDAVALTGSQLFVNGKPEPMIAVSADSRGGRLSPYPTPLVLSRDHYWLVSVPDGGFDSRYFGPVHRSAFTHKAYRVF